MLLLRTPHNYDESISGHYYYTSFLNQRIAWFLQALKKLFLEIRIHMAFLYQVDPKFQIIHIQNQKFFTSEAVIRLLKFY